MLIKEVTAVKLKQCVIVLVGHNNQVSMSTSSRDVCHVSSMGRALAFRADGPGFEPRADSPGFEPRPGHIQCPGD